MSHEVVCFQMLDFETSNSKSEVSKSNSWKNTSFSKTTSLQREPFLTMFYTVNLSPIPRYQVKFYANNCINWIPIVSTAIKDLQGAAVHLRATVRNASCHLHILKVKLCDFHSRLIPTFLCHVLGEFFNSQVSLFVHV